jgi:pimeloyl-ACP methyl ester carboxylesterase
VTEGWVDNDGVRVHFREHRPEAANGRVPVVVIPGMGERTEEYEWLVDALGARHIVAIDIRGRGLSDAPETGYTWEDHNGDIAAVVDATGIACPVFVAFSRGSSYALGYALAHPGRARALVMGEYFARHMALPPQAVGVMLTQSIRGVPMLERMPERAVRGVVIESREVPLWDRLPELGVPVLVIKGGRRSSILNEEHLEQYRAALPSVEIVVVADAGHDLWSRDPAAYLAVLLPFLERV